MPLWIFSLTVSQACHQKWSWIGRVGGALYSLYPESISPLLCTVGEQNHT